MEHPTEVWVLIRRVCDSVSFWFKSPHAEKKHHLQPGPPALTRSMRFPTQTLSCVPLLCPLTWQNQTVDQTYGKSYVPPSNFISLYLRPSAEAASQCFVFWMQTVYPPLEPLKTLLVWTNTLPIQAHTSSYLYKYIYNYHSNPPLERMYPNIRRRNECRQTLMKSRWSPSTFCQY